MYASGENVREAYNAIAKEIVNAETSDDFLEDWLPLVVHHFGSAHYWWTIVEMVNLKYALQGPIQFWKGRRMLMSAESPDQTQKESDPGTTLASETDRRQRLLMSYKKATGNPSNKRIYEASNSGLHKPEFYSWRKGNLPSDSATCINFERFLNEKKPPIPRKPHN
jgi:hypothetical protein